MTCRCGHKQFEEKPQEIKVPPKVLYFDIETAPYKMTYEGFELRVRSGWLDWHNIDKPFFIISWAAAWVNFEGKEKIVSGAVTGTEAKRRTDKRHLWELWELVNNADYVVGHNSNLFDIKKMETRLILNNMPQPAEYAKRDTLQIVKRRFKAESNAMDYWCKLFKAEQKEHMVKEDWLEVTKGNQKIIDKMVHYNRGDVRRGIVLLKKIVKYIESNSKVKVFP